MTNEAAAALLALGTASTLASMIAYANHISNKRVARKEFALNNPPFWEWNGVKLPDPKKAKWRVYVKHSPVGYSTHHILNSGPVKVDVNIDSNYSVKVVIADVELKGDHAIRYGMAVRTAYQKRREDVAAAKVQKALMKSEEWKDYESRLSLESISDEQLADELLRREGTL